MVLPRVKIPTAWRSGDPATRDDLRRLRQACEELAVQVEALSAFAEAHAVEHQDGGADEINVAGLSGTLADTQKIAFKKNSTFVADQRGVNFVEGTGVTLAVTEDSPLNTVDVEISASGGAGQGRNLFFDPPASPDAFDDEFDDWNTGGDPDLANRGWSVTDGTGTTMTRAGDVDPWMDATSIAASQYRSTLTASGLLVQSASEMTIWKACTGSFQIRTYAHTLRRPGSGVGTVYCGPVIGNTNPAANVPANKYVYILNYAAVEEVGRHDGAGGGAVFLALQTAALTSTGQENDFARHLDWNASTNQVTWFSCAPWGWSNDFQGAYTWPAAAFTPAHAGILVRTSLSTTNSVAVIRYIRKAAQGSFPGL